MIAREIANLQKYVEQLLRDNASYRDSDQLLWARTVQDRVGGVKMLQEMSAYELLRKFTKGELPSYESVSRCARKAKELHKELRGINYETKKNHEVAVRKELGYNV